MCNFKQKTQSPQTLHSFANKEERISQTVEAQGPKRLSLAVLVHKELSEIRGIKRL